jgi:hypothetical protein
MEAILTLINLCPSIDPEGLRKTFEFLGYNARRPSRNSNRQPPEYRHKNNRLC